MVLADRLRTRHRQLRAGAVTLALALGPALTSAEPFQIRDQNPLLAGFELPPALPAQWGEDGEWRFDAQFHWGSTAVVQSGTRETLIVDAETQELRLSIGRALPNGYFVQGELPYRRTRAGILDDFIDGWHDTFGLPEGARPLLPTDALQIAYRYDEATLIDVRSPREGFGDLTLRLGKRISAAPLTAWLGVKLPTGDADRLTGSGSFDASAALAFESSFAERYTVFAQIGASYLGDGDHWSQRQRNFVGSGMLGLSARAFGKLTLALQLDAHTAVFDSDEDLLGEVAMLSIGGNYGFADGWDFSFAVVEDLAAESTADVVFVFALRRTLR